MRKSEKKESNTYQTLTNWKRKKKATTHSDDGASHVRPTTTKMPDKLKTRKSAKQTPQRIRMRKSDKN